MADFYATCRSNYVRVTDKEKFKEICERYKVGYTEDDIHKDIDRVGFLVECFDKGTCPDGYNDCGDWIEKDIMEEIAEILADGEVFIIQEIGAEKLRYLGGWAIAINNKKERVKVDIHDIYDLARGVIPSHMNKKEKEILIDIPLGDHVGEVSY